MDDFEKFMNSVNKIPEVIKELSRWVSQNQKWSLKMLLSCSCLMTKLQEMSPYFLQMRGRQWFLKMKSQWRYCEDFWNCINFNCIIEYCINLLDKAAAGFVRFDSNFERNYTKCYQSIVCYRETIHERKSSSVHDFIFVLFKKKLPQPPHPSATTTLASHHSSILRQDSPPAKYYDSFRLKWWLAFFDNKVFF